MGIECVYSISAGAASAGIGIGATGWFLPGPLMLAKDEGGSLAEHWWFHRGRTGMCWMGRAHSLLNPDCAS